jgi:hypothetical protein
MLLLLFWRVGISKCIPLPLDPVRCFSCLHHLRQQTLHAAV